MGECTNNKAGPNRLICLCDCHPVSEVVWFCFCVGVFWDMNHGSTITEDDVMLCALIVYHICHQATTMNKYIFFLNKYYWAPQKLKENKTFHFTGTHTAKNVITEAKHPPYNLKAPVTWWKSFFVYTLIPFCSQPKREQHVLNFKFTNCFVYENLYSRLCLQWTLFAMENCWFYTWWCTLNFWPKTLLTVDYGRYFQAFRTTFSPYCGQSRNKN